MATYAGHTYTNGNVPAAILAPLDGQPHALLRRDAADAWNRGIADVKARTGIVLRVRGWNRTIAEQDRFFFERYEPRAIGSGPFGDVRWYKGRRYVRVRGAAAAIPGTSNHGWGLAVDVEDFGNVGQFGYPRRAQTIDILKRHGWTDDEGRGVIQEPWHLVYDPARDTKPSITAPPKKEGFLMGLSDKEQDTALEKIIEAAGGVNRLEKIFAMSTKNESMVSVIRRIDENTRRNDARYAALAAAMDSMAKLVGIDPAELRASIDKAVAASLGRMERDFHETLSDLTVTLTTNNPED